MDYVHPIRTVIPGVQGRVLEALTWTSAPMTMRHIAQLAGVSQSQAAQVLGSLAEAGLVRRREVGRSSLVMLEPESPITQAIMVLAHARAAVLENLTASARTIRPAPVTLMVFGSFARRQAGDGSDLDILAVRPDEVAPDDDWPGLWDWLDRAGRVSGLPVNPLVMNRHDVADLSGPLLRNIEEDGILLCGRPIGELVRA